MSVFFPQKYGATTTSIFTSGCKINLGLKVLEPRNDGYHNLETFFLPLAHPHDTLSVTWQPKAPPLSFHPDNLRIKSSDPLISPNNNTLSKIYSLYATHTGFAPRLDLLLNKEVPLGGGLGGGSANAAVFLQFLESCRLVHHQNFIAQSHILQQNFAPQTQILQAQHPQFQNSLSTGIINGKHAQKLEAEELQRIALQVGADVPFFLINKPAFATGIGQHLQQKDNPFAKKELLLVCPNIHINTAWAFAALSSERKSSQVLQKNCKKNLTYSPSHDISSFACELHFENDFEEIVFKSYPELRRIKQYLLECGATHALMSGTGASVFGLFSNKERAQEAMQGIANTAHRAFLQTV